MLEWHPTNNFLERYFEIVTLLSFLINVYFFFPILHFVLNYKHIRFDVKSFLFEEIYKTLVYKFRSIIGERL
jgi:hypothetical protein